MKKRAAFHNLGCRVNSYETELMTQRFLECGYEVRDFDSEADIYIINTCTVTQIADKKSRQMISRARRRNPHAVIVAVGCAVETGGVTDTQTADIVIGNTQKADIVDIVEEYIEKGKKREIVYAPEHGRVPVCDKSASLAARTAKTRAFIKIQDGCDQFCSYCIIPYARGKSRSRNEGEILDEIRILAGAGVREVVLNGINLSAYGENNPDEAGGAALVNLAERVSEISGIERIRLGSLEPRVITRENVYRLKNIKGLCPHFHLSLQSGCDSVLKRMNRRYTCGEFRQGVELLREAFDRPAVAADVITGFPGEGDDEHRETVRFLEKIKLYELHVFPYSRRDGTKAASMDGQLPRSIKEERCSELLILANRCAREYRESFIGVRAEVLLEEKAVEGAVEMPYLTGLTDRYIRAALPAAEAQRMGIREGDIAVGKLSGFITESVMSLELEERVRG